MGHLCHLWLEDDGMPAVFAALREAKNPAMLAGLT